MWVDVSFPAPGQGETSCCVCKGESSDAPNKIVLCDNCGLGEQPDGVFSVNMIVVCTCTEPDGSFLFFFVELLPVYLP